MNLLIADDHIMVLEMLKDYIELHIPDSKVDIARDYMEFQKFLRSDVFYDLAIMDYKMPGVEGLVTIRNLLTQYRHMAIAVMSGQASNLEIKEFINLGVIGFIPKTQSPKITVSAINLMLNGERYLPSALIDDNGLLNSSMARATSATDLTPREMDVLTKLNLGYSNKQVARSLDIGEVTVKMYVSRLCRKLNVSNRTHLVVESIKLGLI